MNPIHQDDLQTIGNAHFTAHSRIGIALAHLQGDAYTTGVERGKEMAKQAAIEAGTISPTLCQTIHLGQPGVTVEPCLMLGPADDEVACLLFTASGTEVRLTWPTQTQALAVLAAATGEQVGQEPGLYAAHIVDNWDGEGDRYWLIARLDDKGEWLSEESGKALLQREGDQILSAIPLETQQPAAPVRDVAGLVDALSRLERACDRRAALLTSEVYRMCSLIPGMDDALLELQDARKQARGLLDAHQNGGPES